MTRIAVVFLVDQRGRVLLQERDEFAPRSPNVWGMVGGHVEPEEDFDTAVYRELAEETGVQLAPGELTLWQDTEFHYADGYGGAYRVYAGGCRLVDEDIVVGEGRRIVFVAPEDTVGLAKAESCGHFLPLFLASDCYRALVGHGR